MKNPVAMMLMDFAEQIEKNPSEIVGCGVISYRGKEIAIVVGKDQFNSLSPEHGVKNIVDMFNNCMLERTWID